MPRGTGSNTSSRWHGGLLVAAGAAPASGDSLHGYPVTTLWVSRRHGGTRQPVSGPHCSAQGDGRMADRRSRSTVDFNKVNVVARPRRCPTRPVRHGRPDRRPSPCLPVSTSEWPPHSPATWPSFSR
jgi:hypothetical protein